MVILQTARICITSKTFIVAHIAGTWSGKIEKFSNQNFDQDVF